ncbi:MAG: DUF4920 domain-containing protein [Tepidisphaerales bacterium]
MRRVVLAVLTGSVAVAGVTAGCAKSEKATAASAGGLPAAACATEGDGKPMVASGGKVLQIGDAPKLTHLTPVPVSVVLADPSAYAGKPVRVMGTIDQVCETRGCWVTLKDGASGRELFVKFTCSPEGGRIVPMEAAGKLAIVEGEVEIREISEADARHFAEDAGKSKEEIAKIVGPQKQVRVASPNVQIAMGG